MRDDTTDYSTWIAIYQHISRRCVIYKRLTWMSVVIIVYEKAGQAQLRIVIQQHPCLFYVRSSPLNAHINSFQTGKQKAWMHVESYYKTLDCSSFVEQYN